MTPERIHLSPAFAPPAQQLVLAPALHRLLASHAATPVEAGMTPASAEGRARVRFRLLELQAAMRVSAELAGGIHESGLLIVARSPSPRPAAATRRVTLEGASRLALLPGLDAGKGGEVFFERQRGLRFATNLPGQLAHEGDGAPRNAFEPQQVAEIDVLTADQRRTLHLGQHRQLARVPDRQRHDRVVGLFTDLRAELPLQSPHANTLAGPAVDTSLLRPRTPHCVSLHARSRRNRSTVGNAALEHRFVTTRRYYEASIITKQRKNLKYLF